MRCQIIFLFFLIWSLGTACTERATQKIETRQIPTRIPPILYWSVGELEQQMEALGLHPSCTIYMLGSNTDTIPLLSKTDLSRETMPIDLIINCESEQKAYQLILYDPFMLESGSVDLLDTLPSDPSCFTQGLTIKNQQLYTSCGLYGQSKLTAVPLTKKGRRISQQVDNSYFLEGIDFYHDDLIALTWKEQQLFRVNQQLEFIDTLALPKRINEGWGLFVLQDLLYISNGTDKIYICTLHEEELQIQRVLPIHMSGKPVNYINEMAVVDDSTFAFNRLDDSTIYLVALQTGGVKKTLDLSQISKNFAANGVLNGIHFEQDTLWFTGKNWPFIFKAVYK